MASNHTEHSAITDKMAVSYLWDYLKKSGGVSKEQAMSLAETGILSVSNLLEQTIADTGKLKRSNADGEDFADGSDAKYMRARNIPHSKGKNGKQYERTFCSLSALSVRNKKGSLRVFITYLDERIGKTAFRMFVLPYPDWQKKMSKGANAILFSFSNKDGSLTKTTSETWGMYEVKTFKEFSKKA
jgi:hypothetical protein